jgi:molybdenum cofactor guanylyltransferase
MNATFGAILAGGESRRFGAPKALAELERRPLVRWVSDTLAELTTKAVLVGPEGRIATASGLHAIQDVIPGLGPLGGLHAALTWLAREGGEGMLIVGCDTPLVSRRLLEAVRSDGEDSRIAKAGGRLHPLCGYYRIETLPYVARQIQAGHLGLHALVAELSVDVLDADALLGVTQADRELTNVNTPEEFRALQETAG